MHSAKANLICKFAERFEIDKARIGYLNLINGSVFVDDSYNSKSLDDFFEKCSESEKKTLKELGFILDQNESSFAKEYLQMLKKEKENLIPEFVTWILGFECNFSCPYCTPKVYEEEHHSGGKFDLKRQEFLKKSFEMVWKNEFLLKGAKEGVGLYGGEPFLNSKQRIEEVEFILEEFKKINPKTVVIPTNAFELDKFAESLKILTDADVPLTLQITLDGPPEVHNLTRRMKGQDTFKRIVDNINLVLEKNPKVRFKLRTNISSFNKDHLKTFVQYVKNSQKHWINNPRILLFFIPIFDCHFTNTDQNNISDKELFDFFIFLKKQGINNFKSHPIFDILINALNGKGNIGSNIRCKNITFTADGKIYDCAICDSVSVVGDVFEGKLDIEKIKEHWKGQKYNIPKCQECKYLFLCNGGDRLAAIKKTGSPASPMCDSFRKNFPLFFQQYLKNSD